MDCIVAVHSDIGIQKTTNQDSLLVLQAKTGQGNIVLAAVCDGMGGLAMGEVASTMAVKALDQWFRQEMPQLLVAGLTPETLRESWGAMVYHLNRRVMEYGKEKGLNLGTTLVALLLVKEAYYIINVGDSRVYCVTGEIYQLTKDQTLVQREIDQGHITPQQALTDPQRNVLLQCVGVNSVVTADFFSGKTYPGAIYLLCSDGFRHKVTPAEMLQKLQPGLAKSEKDLKESLIYLTELNIKRLENDNISSIAIKI